MPEGMASLGTVFAPKDYVNLMLTGVHATDPTSAAYTLALDVRRRRWDEELLAVTRAGRWVLPDLAGATDVVGRVLPEAARTTGLPAGIPVATGGPDGTVGAAAILGTDTDCIGDIAGTTDVVVRVVPAPDPAPAGVVVNPYLADGLWSQGGPTGMTGGGATYWLQMLGQDPAELLLEALTTVGPGSDGLRALPHLTGSRFPVWQPEERGWLAGLSPRHRPGHIVRAVHEGAAFAVREALDILDPGSMAPVLLAGGVAKSEGLIRLRADVTGRRTLTRTAPDASLLGAARIAQLAIGIHDSWPAAVASGPPVGSPVEPAVAAVKTYQEEYDDWRTLRSAIAPRE
jgi:sugar (pentulose or hexulose) kinase